MGVFAISCEDDLTYKGSALVEFSPYSGVFGNVQEFDDGHFMYEIDGGDIDSIQISLIAPHFDRDIKGKFIVLEKFYYIKATGKVLTSLPDGIEEGDYDEYETTAEAGVDYEFLNDVGGEFTIEANSSFGFIKIKTFKVENDKDLLLMLIPSEDVEVSENYKYFYLEIKD